MFFSGSETLRVNEIINASAKSMDFLRFAEKEIEKFKLSKKRRDMLTGERYYRGKHDILERKRTVIGQGGSLTQIDNLPNNKIVDNQYARIVDQKNNYLLSKEITFNCSSKEFSACIKNTLGKDFMRLIKNVGEDCLNCGIGWIYVYYDESGRIAFKRFKPYEIIPFWKDSEHSVLDFVIRIYEIDAYEGEHEKIIEKAELYGKDGVERFIVDGGRLVPDGLGGIEPYARDENGNSFCFGRIPFIPFRANSKEIPLINRVKSLQDSLNIVISDFMNNMQEDARNTILVLKNYDGTNLGEFRKNLAEFGVVKVKSIDGADGGVSALKIDVDSSNYKTIADLLKKAVVENARGIDSKDDRMSGNLSRMNIQSIYSDIDLDANSTETEFKVSIGEIIDFIRLDIKKFENENVDIIFNRDILINETESIDNCIKSLNVLSRESVIAQHPWVDNVENEIKKLKGENR